MSLGGRTFRACRPSRFSQQEELDEGGGQVKQTKILLYARRAKAGKPLFEPVNVLKPLTGNRDVPIA